MNESPSNQTGLNDTFSSQPAPQTNPFTADLKGEFTSNFGTNTNAVSQIFKEGGFTGTNRTKYLIIGGVLIAVLAIVFFALTSEDSEEGDLAADESADGVIGEEAEEDGEAVADETAADETTEAIAETAVPAEGAVPVAAPSYNSGASIGSGPIALNEPADGSSLNYDETQGPAMFSWTGGGGYIIFSRNASMKPQIIKVPVSGNSYAFHHPWPGTWYWKVQNKSGSTEARSFTVGSPVRRNIAMQNTGAVAGNGGTISWQGDAGVAYYRVEFSNGSWANPQFRFASSGNSVQVQSVPAGTYQMRLGAFSEVSGRWEYTAPSSVTVQ